MGTAEAVRGLAPQRAAPQRGSYRALARLTTRLLRRGALLVAVGLGVWMAFEAFAFEVGYPDAQARASLLVWAQDPGLRMIGGWPTAVDTLGGFVVWDAGLYLTLIIGVWALRTTTRLLRGDEDAGRAEVVLAGPVRPTRGLLVQLLVLLAAGSGIGLVVGLTLAVSGAQPLGSLLIGLVLAGYCAAVIGVAAVASQVFASRGLAVGVSAGVLAAWVLLRIVSNSQESRSWLGWLSPPGWIDLLRAYGDNRWPVLLVPLAMAIALVVVAVLLRSRRDTYAGLVAERMEHRSRRWGLGSPLAFAWRANLGVLVGWAAAVAVMAAVVGTMVPTIADFIDRDPSYAEILTKIGMSPDDVTRGFASLWGVLVGLVVAVYAAFRMGAARGEEASTRAEILLTRPVTRWRWLGGHVACLVASVLVLSAVAALAMWLGAAAAGALLTAGDCLAAVFNALPVVVVFAGLSVLAFGVVPRLTVALGVTAVAVAYLLEVVGPLLEWPSWALGLSPFRHLAQVPIDPVAWPAALVMTATGVLLAAAGFVAFQRRDLTGA